VIYLIQTYYDIVTFYSDSRGILFVVLAGVFAFVIDYFALKAYGSGLSISIAGPIIIGGSIAVATLVGFLIGDSITWIKILGVTMVIVGASILAVVNA